MRREDNAYMVIIHVLHIGFISNRLLSIAVLGLPRIDGQEWCLESEGPAPHNGRTFKNGKIKKGATQGCQGDSHIPGNNCLETAVRVH
jgi:hypothetical protein